TETARRIRAEEARHREEAVHRLLVERSTDLLAVLDATGTVRYASPAAERLLGYPEGSLEGERALDLVHPEDRDRIEAAVAEASGDPDHAAVVEHRVRHADGTFRYFESTGRDLLEDPDIHGIVVNARDVTDRTTLEEELRHAQKMEAVGRLAAGVAHQFNNLLTVIRVSARLLEDHFEGSSPPEELVDIDSAAGEAAVLTRRLLAFSGRETLEPRPLDLGEVIRGLESFLRRVAGHAVELEIDLPGQPLPIRADALQIEQVALDLFENALEAMPDGGRLAIQVSPARAGDVPAQIRRPDEWALLRVRDAGPGVPEAIRDEIFEPFFTTKEAGTGLGLATVRSAVSRLGGLVLLSSDPDRGATFTVCLPRFSGSEDDEAGEGGPHESRTRTESAATGPTGGAERAGAAADPPAEGPGVAGVAPPEEPVAARTVLVVDGDAATRSVVERLLAEDFRVLSAEDGVTALTLLDAFGGTLDLLVTAVEMPQISGEALAARVSTTHPDLEVIYLTEDETAAGKGTPRLTRDTLASRLRPVVGELLPVPEAPL
ncbi:MAG TPA: ATP-binding protein, partial [Longimicrobiales bacterium]|nr:ATP-binding protein [Longimicrobiales bacterium]